MTPSRVTLFFKTRSKINSCLEIEEIIPQDSWKAFLILFSELRQLIFLSINTLFIFYSIFSLHFRSLKSVHSLLIILIFEQSSLCCMSSYHDCYNTYQNKPGFLEQKCICTEYGRQDVMSIKSLVDDCDSRQENVENEQLMDMDIER